MQESRKRSARLLLAAAVVAGLLVGGAALPASAAAGSLTLSPSSVTATSTGAGGFDIILSGWQANVSVTTAAVNTGANCTVAGTGAVVVDGFGNGNQAIALTGCNNGTELIQAWLTADTSQLTSQTLTVTLSGPTSGGPKLTANPSSITLPAGTTKVSTTLVGTGWVAGTAVAFTVSPQPCTAALAFANATPDANGTLTQTSTGGTGCSTGTVTITGTQALAGGGTNTASATFTINGPGSTTGPTTPCTAATVTAPATVNAPVFGAAGTYSVTTGGTTPVLTHTGTGVLAGTVVTLPAGFTALPLWIQHRLLGTAYTSTVSATNACTTTPATAVTSVNFVLFTGSPI